MANQTRLYEMIDFPNRMTAKEYLNSMNENREAAAKMYKVAELTDDELKLVRESVKQHGGRIDVVAMTADWCGDAAMNLPLFFKAADKVDGLFVRVFRPADLPKVETRFKHEGYDRLPIIVFFDSRRNEIGRFVERPRAADQRVADYWQQKPDPNKLMASNDEKKIGEAIGLFKQFVADMQKWYQDGLWRETAAEWIATIHR